VPFSSEGRKGKRAQPFLQALLQAPPPVLLELVHSFADDLYTFSVLGLLGKRFGERAARFSDWCWMLATLVGLVENGVERGLISSQQHSGKPFLTFVEGVIVILMGFDNVVESRMYQATMSAATNKSKVSTSRVDERELSRLQNQDYWLSVTRWKLLMDLIFVCKFTVAHLADGLNSLSNEIP